MLIGLALEKRLAPEEEPLAPAQALIELASEEPLPGV
jgi:hypothetical protein